MNDETRQLLAGLITQFANLQAQVIALQKVVVEMPDTATKRQETLAKLKRLEADYMLRARSPEKPDQAEQN